LERSGVEIFDRNRRRCKLTSINKNFLTPEESYATLILSVVRSFTSVETFDDNFLIARVPVSFICEIKKLPSSVVEGRYGVGMINDTSACSLVYAILIAEKGKEEDN
jgi:hypothetical protein